MDPPLIYNELAICQRENEKANQVNEETSFTHPPSCILPSFSKNTSRLLLRKSLSKCASTISFRKCKRKLVLLVNYLFNYDSSQSTFFMLNMEFNVLLSTAFVKWIGILRFLQCKEYKNILLYTLCFDMHFFVKT